MPDMPDMPDINGETDVLDWLLPEVDEAERNRARRLVTFARLMHDDARGARGGATAIALSGARRELDRVASAGLRGLYADLLRFHLEAECTRDSWADFGRPRIALDEICWARLERLRPSTPGLPRIPGPGESALAVADRVLDAARRHDADPVWLAIWEARRTGIVDGPMAAEAAWRALLDRARGAESSTRVECLAVASIARSLLDRFDVRGARELLDGNVLLASVDDELASLSAWVHVLAGDPCGARELLGRRPRRTGRIPLPLGELRVRVPGWASILTGSVSEVGRDPAPEKAASRRALHAAVYAVFALRPDRSLAPVLLDAAPAIRDRVNAAWKRRDGAWTRAGEPEHRVLLQGEADLSHRQEGELRGSLGGPLSRALALVPVFDQEGEAVGWLHVETEHHLLPSRARLEALAHAWRREVIAVHGPPRVEVPDGTTARHVSFPWGDPRVAAARGLVGANRHEVVAAPRPLAGRRRGRWRGHSRGGRRPRRLARRTGRTPRPRPGAANRQPRSIRARGSAVVDPRPRGLGSGRSPRRSRPGARLLRGGVFARAGLRPGRFRSDRRLVAERRLDLAGGPVPGLAPCALRVRRAPRSDDSVVARTKDRSLAGGAGRVPRSRSSDPRARARSSSRAGSTSRARIARGLSSCAGARKWGDSLQRGGTVVIDDVDRRDPEEQMALLRSIETGSAQTCRIVVLLRDTVRTALRSGALNPDLAAFFEPLEVRVAPLCDRRDEIPELVRVLGLRAAETERVDRVVWTDDALALLWRQRWAGNVRELEALVHRLVLLHAGGEVSAAGARAAARRGGHGLRDRMPSKRPRPEDVTSALETTARRSGSINKTRAARYLGWDPDTLVARLGDQGPHQD